MRYFIYLLLTVALNAQTYTVFSRETGCLAHWVLDSTYAAYKGKYVLYDYSGNGNDLVFASSGDDYTAKLTADNSFIPSGMVIDPVPANLDRLILSGSAADFADIDENESLTIIGRHKWEGSTKQFIGNRLNTTTGNIGWLLEQRSGGVFRFYFSDGTNVVNGAAVSTGISNDAAGTWAVVLDRSTELTRVYANGDSVGVNDWSAETVGSLVTSAAFTIYNNGALSGAYTDSPVYELQIYNVALTTDQISAIMSNQEVVNATRRKKCSGFNGWNKY